MIKIEGLYANAGKAEILRGIDLSVEKGEFIALVGPNGAGKTTLLRHLNGLRKPTSGRVIVNDLDTRKARINEFARTVGFLFQNPDHQIISNSVGDEIKFGLKHTGIPHDEWEDRVAEAAKSTGIKDLLGSDPFTLSRPLRQRVALASVLALRPAVLVLDEPTSAQDENGATQVMEIARNLNASGVTIILVSHDMELVARYAGRVLTLVEGRIISDCSVPETFCNEELLEHAGLAKPGAYRLASALKLSTDCLESMDAFSIAAAVEASFAGVKV